MIVKYWAIGSGTIEVDELEEFLVGLLFMPISVAAFEKSSYALSALPIRERSNLCRIDTAAVMIDSFPSVMFVPEVTSVFY